MNPLKLIRKLGKLLRGGSTSRQIFLAVFFGFAVGMTPGVNLTLLIFIACVLVLNTNGGLAMLSFAVGKIFCLLLAPVTFLIGYFLIYDAGLARLVRYCADTPVLALLDFQVYCLLGALPLIIILGGAMGWGAATLINRLRRGIVSATESSERARKLGANKFVRFGLWVAFGKQKGNLADALARKTPLLAKGRIIAGVVLVAVVVILQLLFLDTLVRKGLRAAISSATGAEVNIARAKLSLINGRLVIEGLQVTDAAKPTHNQLQADRIVADLSIGDLLAKRFVVDLVSCDAMQMDVLRSSPGEVYRKPDRAEEPTLPALDLGKLQRYYAHVKDLNDKLDKLREYLESDEPAAKETPDKDKLRRQAEALGYLRLSAQDALAEHPTWIIRRIEINNLRPTPDLPGLSVKGANLSSHPSLVEEKADIKAYPDEQTVQQLKEGLGDMLFKRGDKDEDGEKGKKTSPLDRLFGK